MRAGIALGSNIEPRLSHLQRAAKKITELSTDPASVLYSRIYETVPIGCPPGSGNFLNAAMEISCEIMPRQLLSTLKQIEEAMGRQMARQRNAPRPIDLDILYYGELEIEENELIIPHPRMTERAFVLQPLADICPDKIIKGQSISNWSLCAKSAEIISSTSYLLKVS